MKEFRAIVAILCLTACGAAGAERRVGDAPPCQTFDDKRAGRPFHPRCIEDRARLAAAYSNCIARIDRPAEGVVVPVENHPDGSVKMDVTADKAQFFDKEGLVWCGGVVLREYAPDGTLKMELAAKECIVDRKTKSGWLAGRAKGKYGETEVAGCDIWFSAENEAVEIGSGVEITSTGIKLEGLKL